MSNRWQNSAQNFAVNWGPLSETISTGIPCRRRTCGSRILAISLTEGRLGRGTKCAILEKRSTIERIVVLPAEQGRPVTKSTKMWDQGLCGVDRGRNRSAGACFEVLAWAQMEQAATNSWVSFTQAGHHETGAGISDDRSDTLVILGPESQRNIEQA